MAKAGLAILPYGPVLGGNDGPLPAVPGIAVLRYPPPAPTSPEVGGGYPSQTGGKGGRDGPISPVGPRKGPKGMTPLPRNRWDPHPPPRKWFFQEWPRVYKSKGRSWRRFIHRSRGEPRLCYIDMPEELNPWGVKFAVVSVGPMIILLFLFLRS
jgi:hypothetical protein